MKDIRNVVIDLGGVMIDLNRERCVAAFEALDLEGVDNMLGLYRQEEPFLSVETGRISTAGFYDKLRSLIGKEVEDSTLIFFIPVSGAEHFMSAEVLAIKLFTEGAVI